MVKIVDTDCKYNPTNKISGVKTCQFNLNIPK